MKLESNGLTKREQKAINKERIAYHKDVLKRAKKAMREEKSVSPEAYISLQNVNKIYPNHVQAVYDFNLDIKEKEFIVFVGPSGCGKSTTLRMVAGLEDITSGDLFIDGVYANELPPKARKVGMVFQSYALYPHMTVYENMAFGLKVQHYAKDDIDARIKEAAEILQLEEYLNRKPNALSGGQCQRVALGRAIVMDSKVFLMDEPLSNLDAKLRVAMRSEIIRLHRRLNTTSIYVTHDQTEAMTMADRIVVMSKGYVQQIGTPDEIFNNPSNLFVATFIGAPAMNIINVKLVDNKIVLSNGYTVDLGKDLTKKVLSFYASEVDRYNKQILDYKATLLTREQEENRYRSIFVDETKMVDRAKRYLTKFTKLEVLDSMDLTLEDLLAKVEVEDIEQFLNGFIPEYLYAESSIENPNTKELNDNLEKVKEIVNKKEIPLVMGVRPEHIFNSELDNKDAMKLPVAVAELLGSEYYAHMDFDNSEIVARVDVKTKIKNGETLAFTFYKDAIHLFDPISTRKINR